MKFKSMYGDEARSYNTAKTGFTNSIVADARTKTMVVQKQSLCRA